MYWLSKAALQTLISIIPFGDKLYLDLQRKFGNLRDPSVWTRYKELMQLLSEFRKYYQDLSALCVVEIGTGWIPHIPLGLSLVGTREIRTYDIKRLMDPRLLRQVIPQYEQILGPLSMYASDGQVGVQERYQLLRRVSSEDLDSLLHAMRIAYSAPANAAHTHLSDEAVDLVISVSVLEHVNPSMLNRVFLESRRILKQGGYMIHLIDLTDHFAHDRNSSISRVNFLQYTDLVWSMIGSNRFSYHNRLRPPDFLRFMQEAGFTIISRDAIVNEHSLEVLTSMRVAPRFRQYRDVDLATDTLLVVARK